MNYVISFLLIVVSLSGYAGNVADISIIDDPCPSIGMIRLSISETGVVKLNGKVSSVEAAKSVIAHPDDSVEGICFHRAGPGKYDPHENAMEVLRAIAKEKTPAFFLYFDEAFTERVIFHF
jgi:hypothetical protein